MKRQKYIQSASIALTITMLACALLLTFTISDYYIFNRAGQFNVLFVISQWVKKSGLLLIPMAIFYKKRCCADIAKYFLPLFIILSCALFEDFFDITKVAETDAQIIYNQVNLFMPKWLNITLFFVQNAAMLTLCALLFARDGFKAQARSFIFLAPAMLACMPLNIFENFFDINAIPADSFLRFKNFTIWHLIAILILAGFTIASYYFLKNKNAAQRNGYLGAMAIVLLLQYHSKDSMVMGDGYNVYHTVLACVPLFICNIGVYVASLSVFLKKKTLYSIAFFVHAVGALSVFVYFGKDEMSNYGIFCSYSILYFCLTHALLFALSVLPSALGMYKFNMKDCIVPLIYYFIVIVAASVCSALVTSASMTWHTPDGIYLDENSLIMPNYAFTQINPLPFSVPAVWVIKIWNYDVNMLYILGLYAAYVALFFAFTGAYYAFIAVRGKVLASERFKIAKTAAGELAAAENDDKSENDRT